MEICKAGAMRSTDAEIRELMVTYHSHRLTDPEFDEICRDFETLLADLSAAARNPTAGKDRSVPNDLQESLKGLEQEIRAKIAGLEKP